MLAQTTIGLKSGPATTSTPVRHVEQVALVACPSPATYPCTVVSAGATGAYTYTVLATPIASMGADVHFTNATVLNGNDQEWYLTTFAAPLGQFQFNLNGYVPISGDYFLISYYSTK
jgi:hypothetical protein